ncbi:MAG: hypothetical protein IKX67_07850 [Bacteroidales bacterium]|nr:hypothetical protein [Bacteroidales bacterium]
MKRRFRKIILLLALVLLPACLWGQKRIYTKSFRLQDFKSKTTKVVLGGSDALNASIRQEVTSLWTISPYEFCTPAQYEKQKTNPDLCFLCVEKSRGIIFLTLSKGGRSNDSNALKRPLEIISIPIAGEQDGSGQELVYMPAFISIIQDYTEAAMNSETVAYTGLGAIAHGVPRGVTVYSNPEAARKAFTEGRADSAVKIIISPDGNPSSKPRHKLTFGTLDYRLYSYGKRAK